MQIPIIPPIKIQSRKTFSDPAKEIKSQISNKSDSHKQLTTENFVTHSPQKPREKKETEISTMGI